MSFEPLTPSFPNISTPSFPPYPIHFSPSLSSTGSSSGSLSSGSESSSPPPSNPLHQLGSPSHFSFRFDTVGAPVVPALGSITDGSSSVSANPCVDERSAAQPSAVPRTTCVLCRAAKVRCDGDTPCTRCVRLHKAEQCAPAVVKRKRKQYEPEQCTRATVAVAESAADVSASWLSAMVRPIRREPQSVFEQLDPLGAHTTPFDVSDASVGDSTRLSRLLLRLSLYYFHCGAQEQPKLGDAGRPMHSIVSRWFAYARYASLLSPHDLTNMMHGSAFVNSVPLRTDSDGSKSLLRLHDRSDRTEDGHCDGRICGGMCLGARSLLVHKPVIFTFNLSPTEPIADSEYNNFPCLLFRHDTTDQLRHMEELVDGTVLDYASVVRINSSFERLFGYSQRQVRALYQSQSYYALYRLITPQDWVNVMRLEVAVEYGNSSVEYEGNYQLKVRCRHRMGSEFDCWMHKCYERDDRGIVLKGYYTFIPIKAGIFDAVAAAGANIP